MTYAHKRNIIKALKFELTYGEKKVIVSYIDTDIPDVSHYWELLRKELPYHAVPNFIKLVKSFPYLPNKKRNIKMLQEMFIEELNQKKHQLSIRYRRILDIIYDATEGIIDELDIEKDIRLQGVDSLTFIRIIAMLEDEYEFEFGYDDLENMEIINVKTLYDYVNT